MGLGYSTKDSTKCEFALLTIFVAHQNAVQGRSFPQIWTVLAQLVEEIRYVKHR